MEQYDALIFIRTFHSGTTFPYVSFLQNKQHSVSSNFQ